MTTSIVPYSKQMPLSKKGKNRGKYFSKVSYWWYEWLNQWGWCVFKTISSNTIYAHYSKPSSNQKKPIRIFLHRVITKAKNGMPVDHINHDGLDNTEGNLRVVTHAQNMMNTRGKVNSTSKYVGVSKDTVYNEYVSTKTGLFMKMPIHYWRATIQHNGKSIKLGRFPLTHEGEIEAAKARDKKAIELFGEFANLNFK